MRKYLFTFTLAVLSISAFAQGTLKFANDPATLVRYLDGIPVPANLGFAQLLWAPVGTTFTPLNSLGRPDDFLASNPGWYLYPPPTSIGPEPGRFHGGTLTFDAVPPGGAVDVIVLAWFGTFSDFQVALRGTSFIDHSPRFTIQTGTSAADAPGIVGPGRFDGMTLSIPEPSVFAFASSGAVMLLLLRRQCRKRRGL